MKICHVEAIKRIKELETQKENILLFERNSSRTSFKEGEEKLDSGYSYSDIRLNITNIDSSVRSLKALLAKANSTIMIDEFNMTIGEGLVYLAQLNKERQTLESLLDYPQISRRITSNGVLEYTECNYDIKVVEGELIELRNKINRLQIAIDRANLTSFIEIE